MLGTMISFTVNEALGNFGLTAMKSPTLKMPQISAAGLGLSRRALLPLFAAALAPSALSGSGSFSSGGSWGLAQPASAGEPKGLDAGVLGAPATATLC